MKAKQFSVNIFFISMLLFSAIVAAQAVPASNIAVPQDVSSTTQTQNDVSVASDAVMPSSNQQPDLVTPFYQNANNAAPKIGSGSHLLTVTLGLMAIVGLIFSLSWFVKRFSQGGFSGNTHIKILSAMPLGTRERLVLVEAGGQQLLIGVTANNINTLHVLSTPIVMPEKADITSEFSKKLMAIMQQKNTTDSPSETATNNKNNNNAVG